MLGNFEISHPSFWSRVKAYARVIIWTDSELGARFRLISLISLAFHLYYPPVPAHVRLVLNWFLKNENMKWAKSRWLMAPPNFINILSLCTEWRAGTTEMMIRCVLKWLYNRPHLNIKNEMRLEWWEFLYVPLHVLKGVWGLSPMAWGCKIVYHFTPLRIFHWVNMTFQFHDSWVVTITIMRDATVVITHIPFILIIHANIILLQ